METLTPFINGKIVAVSANPDLYHDFKHQRGDSRYVMTKSQLTRFSYCPKKWIDLPNDIHRTNSLDWGDLIDCLLLTPDQFDDRFIERPDTYPDSKTGDPKKWSGNSTWCKEWKEDHKELTILPYGRSKMAVEHDDVRKGSSSPSIREGHFAVDKLKDDGLVKAVLRGADTQVWITADYVDPATGITVPCQTLLDILPANDNDPFGRCVVDLKTSVSAHPKKWPKTVQDFRYDVQAAWNLDMVAACGIHRDLFLHIVQESEPSYELGFYWLSQEFIERGRNYIPALVQYAKCIQTKVWQGFPAIGLNWRGFSEIAPTGYAAGQPALGYAEEYDTSLSNVSFSLQARSDHDQ